MRYEMRWDVNMCCKYLGIKKPIIALPKKWKKPIIGLRKGDNFHILFSIYIYISRQGLDYKTTYNVINSNSHSFINSSNYLKFSYLWHTILLISL